jgi:hypothetical protein
MGRKRGGKIVKCLEDLLPKPAKRGALRIYNPYDFETSFVSNDRKKPVILSLKINNNGHGNVTVPLYVEDEFYTIFKVSEKDSLKVNPSLFQGEIGERVMRATLDVVLRNISAESPSFQYRFFRGEHREIISYSKKYLMAFGKFANIFIYELKDSLETNPLHNPNNPQSQRHVGTSFDKEKIRDLFKGRKSEFDGCVEWWKGQRKGLILCEAKTCGKGNLSATDIKDDYETVVLPAKKLYPEHEMWYLLMGCPSTVCDKNMLHTTRVVKSMHDFYKERGVPFIVLPFQMGSSRFYHQGQHVQSRYKTFIENNGQDEWEFCNGRVNEKKGAFSLSIGGKKRVLVKVEKGDEIRTDEELYKLVNLEHV